MAENESNVERGSASRFHLMREKMLNATGGRFANAALPDEVGLAVSADANLLLVGDVVQVDSVLDAVRPMLAEPLVYCECSEGLTLPTSESVATLVLRDISALTDEHQKQLVAVLDAGSNRTRVVSTAPFCLLPCVRSGAFSARLYYRLNQVRVDLSLMAAADQDHAPRGLQ